MFARTIATLLALVPSTSAFALGASLVTRSRSRTRPASAFFADPLNVDARTRMTHKDEGGAPASERSDEQDLPREEGDVWLNRIVRARERGLRAREALRAPGCAALQTLDALLPEIELDPVLLEIEAGDLFIDEGDASYTVRMRAPGVHADDLSVVVEDGMLTVSGEAHRTDGNASYSSAFCRSVSLPADADAEVLSTRYEDGQITIELEKLSEASANGSDAVVLESAEALAAESPRFARWLKAHGYLKA